MQNRIVEITSDNVHLALSRGFMKITQGNEKLGQIDVTDMSALIVRGYSASISINLCARLALENVPVVICGANQSPASILWPIDGHHKQGQRMQAQASTTKPLKKRLWQSLVKAKILAQAAALDHIGANSSSLRLMAKRVKTGDHENIEAQAARRYWPAMMGAEFRRGKSGVPQEYATDSPDINALLNYGYTVLRAACARSILTAGLHPSLSLHHESAGDALRLADDLMEPFRPWVDIVAYQCVQQREAGEDVLSKQHKAKLAAVLTMDLHTAHGASPLQLCLDRLATSLAQIFLGEKTYLDLPNAPMPLALHSG
ncbi:MAG: type II CRISPR-associated endonuclease Cas1 [Robiginitomaculum sp.]